MQSISSDNLPFTVYSLDLQMAQQGEQNDRTTM